MMAKSSPLNFALFLSSSSNPNEKNPHEFKMVRDNVATAYDKDLNEHNSIGFDVILHDNITGQEIIFDGTEHLADMELPTKQDYESYKTRMFIPVAVEHRAATATQNNSKSFTFDGTAYVVLDDNSAVVMEAGRYVGTIYVHVIGLDTRNS